MPGHERRTRPPRPGEDYPGRKQNPLAAARERAKAELAQERAAANSGTAPVKAAPGKSAQNRSTEAKAAKPGAAPAAPKAPAGPQLDGEGRPYITLAQLLKKHNLADTGGAAKHLVRAGGITVNSEAEARPGRKLHQGDTVVAAGQTITVALDR